MWDLDCEESWAPKNWCFWTVVLEKTLESPLDCKEIQPVHCKGDQSWVFIGRTDAKAETPIFWPPHEKSWLTGKDSDAGRDWGQKEKGTTEDEMAGWHHRLDGRESEWTPGVDDGQGGLACCDSWGRKESDTTERLNWTELNWRSWFMYCWSPVWRILSITLLVCEMCAVGQQFEHSLALPFFGITYCALSSTVVPAVSLLTLSLLLDILGLKQRDCTTVLYTVLYNKAHKSTTAWGRTHVTMRITRMN